MIEQYEKCTQTELRSKEATSDPESDHEGDNSLNVSPEKIVIKLSINII